MIRCSNMDRHNILLVEDDSRLAELVREYLSQHEFNVSIAARGDTAVSNFTPTTTDLVILDLMLPGLDGLSVCRELRAIFNGPILMLTAKGSDIDQVVGLELGADDYVVKPVEPRVLLARVRSLLRRSQSKTSDQTALQFNSLSINLISQEVTLNEQPVLLTTQEFGLLWLLASRAGTVLSRDIIYQHLRGIEYDGQDRMVDVCISHLRKKLGDDSDQPSGIKTIWGTGYLFVADGWA